MNRREATKAIAISATAPFLVLEDIGYSNVESAVCSLKHMAWKCFYSTDPTERQSLLKQQRSRAANWPTQLRELFMPLLDNALARVHENRSGAYLDIVRWCMDLRCRKWEL